MSEGPGTRSRQRRRESLVEDIMNRNVVTVSESASITEAAAIMKKNDMGCLVVVRGTEPLGIITERDLTRILANGRLDTSSVADLISKPLIVVGPKEPIAKAAKILVDKKIRRLPVAEGSHLVGILTSTDLVRYYDKLSKYMMKPVGP